VIEFWQNIMFHAILAKCRSKLTLFILKSSVTLTVLTIDFIKSSFDNTYFPILLHVIIAGYGIFRKYEKISPIFSTGMGCFILCIVCNLRSLKFQIHFLPRKLTQNQKLY
jgi:hypothetical protein